LQKLSREFLSYFVFLFKGHFSTAKRKFAAETTQRGFPPKAFTPKLNWNKIIQWHFSREFNKKMAVRMNRNLFDKVRTFARTISSFSLAHTDFKCRRVDRLSKPSALIANYMRRFHEVSNSGPNFFARYPARAHCTDTVA